MKSTPTAWLPIAGALIAASTILAHPLLAQPQLTINNITVTEGQSGSTEAVLTVTLTPAAAGTVTVDYTTNDVTATGGAACGGNTDYVTESGTVQFDPGETSQPIGVVVCGDTAVEPQERFRVRLLNAVGATIQDPIGQVDILNDDAAPALPTLSIGDATFEEGNVGSVSTAFGVTLSAPSGQPVTFVVSILPGSTATRGFNCLSGADFSFLPGVTLTINPGQTLLNVAFFICGDTQFEPDETFTVVLRNPVNAVLGDSLGVMTIRNDDAAPLTISIRDTTVAEGGLGSRDVELTLTLSGFSTGRVTVDHAIQAGGTATTGSACVGAVDFLGGRGGTVQFASGQRSRTIPITICGDLNAESDETFFVALSNPTGAVLGNSVGTVTIRNDDIANAVVDRDENIVVRIEPARAELEVDLTCAGCRTQSAPDLVFFVTARNTGVVSASNVLVRYVLPLGVAFVGVESNQLGTCGQNGTAANGALLVNCTLSSLPAGASRSVLLKGKAPATIADSTQLVSSAIIDPDNTVPEENDLNNTETTTTTVRAPSDLVVTATATKTNVQRLGPPLGACANCRKTVADVAVQLVVRNNGPFQSAPTTLALDWRQTGRILVEFDEPSTGTPLRVETLQVPALAAGGTHVIRRSGRASSQSHDPRTGQVTATVNPAGNVFESLTSNNQTVLSVTLP